MSELDQKILALFHGLSETKKERALQVLAFMIAEQDAKENPHQTAI